MVTVLRGVALSVVAAGCLSKPAVPSDARTDAPDAQPDTPDAFVLDPCTAIPASFRMRAEPVVANFDRRDGSTADDMAFWGRDTATGEAFVYVIVGSPTFSPTCFNRALQFEVKDEILPLDVWVGEITGDSNPDFVMYGRETVTSGPQHHVVLYAGEPTGTIAETPVTRKFPVTGQLETWGGTESSQEPVYVAGWTQTALPPTAALYIGGLYTFNAEVPVDPSPSPLLGAPLVGSNATDMGIAQGFYVQDVASYAAGDPTQMLMVTQGELLRIRSLNDRQNGYSRYEIVSSTALLSSQQRSLRWVRELVGGTMYGVTQNVASGWQLLQVSHIGAEPEVIAPIAGVVVDPYDTTNMALANLAGDARFEFAVITDGTAAEPLLQIYPDLDIAGAATVGRGIVRSVALPETYTKLAVGDFDGVASTLPSIFVLSTTGLPPLCYQYVGSGIAPCP